MLWVSYQMRICVFVSLNEWLSCVLVVPPEISSESWLSAKLIYSCWEFSTFVKLSENMKNNLYNTNNVRIDSCSDNNGSCSTDLCEMQECGTWVIIGGCSIGCDNDTQIISYQCHNKTGAIIENTLCSSMQIPAPTTCVSQKSCETEINSAARCSIVNIIWLLLALILLEL